MKTYYAHIQFEAVGRTVKARNAREARKKVLLRVAKMKPLRLLDRSQLYVEPA